MNIEVEVRSFISEEKYFGLIDFFKENAKLIKEDSQETHYFDCEQDLRIQKNNFASKIWMKKGKIHDDFREEIEIVTDKNDFEKLKKLFENLNHNIEITWLRERKQFDWDGIKVCLDFTEGYGHILELENMGSEENKDKILEELNQKLNELNIEQSTKEEFDEKYQYYRKNWRNLIKN